MPKQNTYYAFERLTRIKDEGRKRNDLRLVLNSLLHRAGEWQGSVMAKLRNVRRRAIAANDMTLAADITAASTALHEAALRALDRLEGIPQDEADPAPNPVEAAIRTLEEYVRKGDAKGVLAEVTRRIEHAAWVRAIDTEAKGESPGPSGVDREPGVDLEAFGREFIRRAEIRLTAEHAVVEATKALAVAQQVDHEIEKAQVFLGRVQSAYVTARMREQQALNTLLLYGGTQEAN